MYAIDLGMTRTKTAVINSAGKAEIVLNSRGEPFTPTAFHFSPDGSILYGTDALEQGSLEPDYLISNFKLMLGTTDNLAKNGKVITPTDAAELILRNAKETAEKKTGIAMTDVVLSCPANFKDNQKQALLEAAKRCGLNVLRLIYEPTAAGLAYFIYKPGDRTIAVYDFGGGTFDVTVLKFRRNQVDILATEGIAQCGGNDLTACIEKRVLMEVEKQLGALPLPQEEPLFYYELHQKSENAKFSLNTRDKVPIVFSVKARQIVVEITKDQFEKDIDPWIQKTLDALASAVSKAGLTYKDIDHIVLVGGTTLLPYIQQRVADVTGIVPKTDIDPNKAIVFGGAYACITELAKDGQATTVNGKVIPVPDLFFRQVTAHPVGCCVVDTSTSQRKLLNAVIIPQNTPIPCQRSDGFYMEHEDQTEVHIEILQGDQDLERDKCLLIGEFDLKGLPREKVRTPRIQIEYTVDVNGMVTATATDKVSGKQYTVSVDYKKGVKPKDKPNSV